MFSSMRTPEEIREYDRQWRLANPEKVKAYAREWKRQHKDVIKTRAAEYDKRPSVKARKKKYRQEHPEIRAAEKARYKKRHPDKIRAAKSARRARKIAATIGDIRIIRDWESTWRRKRSVKCYWCGGQSPGKTCHADHIVPLFRGGEHSINNLCVSCKTCNLKKGPKDPATFNKTLVQPLLLFTDDTFVAQVGQCHQDLQGSLASNLPIGESSARV